MEKIKRALEESKRKQNHRVAENVREVSKAESTNTEKQDEPDVKYEYTRIISLRPDILAKNRIVSFNKNDQLSISFDILRTQVLKKMKENDWRTLAITSPNPACGKTVLSINLAMSIAHQANKTSLLVDFDLRRPSIAKYLGIPTEVSINEVLAGEATVAEALVNPELDRFVVLPTARPVKKSSEILSSKKVSNLVSDLRNKYEERVVIFDLPPILGSDDAMIMMSQVDCVLLVVGNGMVGKDELNESMRYIDSEKFLGAVLNKVEQPKVKRSYYEY